MGGSRVAAPVARFRPDGPGFERVTVDLAALYPKPAERSVFRRRWRVFFASDPHFDAVAALDGDVLSYRTETIVPEGDSRPRVLLLFGNPAPHSVVGGMFFAHEGAGREHRVWRIFREVGLLDVPAGESSTARKGRILSHDYASPLCVGMAVFHSLSSTPSRPPWTGVAGLRRLYGTRAFATIADAERARIAEIVRTFFPSGGTILAFQKDAYEGVRAADTAPYTMAATFTGALHGPSCWPGVDVIAVPPTRMLQGRRAKAALRAVVSAL